MSDTTTSPDLAPLTADYDIVGEASRSDGMRSYIANRKADDKRRRDDPTGVIITVVTTPEGDEANALTHFASDTKTLSGLTHRRLLPVLEGRWLGDDAFAVVSPRISDPTLAQMLASGETFHATRIAAILRDVNGLLEWAREQNIVHRTVTPDQVFLEPKTDRVRVAFAIKPLKRLHQPGPHDDARTIARLAVAMLGGDPDIQFCDQDALANLRPGLPQAFCEVTANLLDPKQTQTSDDVTAYLALIGMSDPLVQGETERDRIRAEILEEQRVEREKLANERAAFEAEMAAARAQFEKEKAQERDRVARERADLETSVTKERAELQRALTAERTALTATREQLERVAAEQRAELERAAAKDRAEIERLKMEIRKAGDFEIEQKRLAALEDVTGDEQSVVDEEQFAPSMFELPVLPPLQPLVFDDETPVLSTEPIAFVPTPEVAPTDLPREEVTPATPEQRATRRRRWMVGGMAAAVLAIAGVTTVVVNNRREVTTAPVARQVVARPVAAAPVAAAPVPAPASAPVAFAVDSTTARKWLDSLRAEHPVDVSWAIDIAAARAARAERARRAAIRDSVAAAGGAPAQASGQASGQATGQGTGQVTGQGTGQVTGGNRPARQIRQVPAPTDSLFAIPGTTQPVKRDTQASSRPDTTPPPR